MINLGQVTLDSHNRNHIAHAIFWEDEKGNHPRNFTLISEADVGTKWWPRERNHLAWCKEYTAQLAEGNRFMHCIWPEHCLIGTPGQTVVPCINDALQYWCGRRLRNIRYVHKGMNNLTEMYSCIQADVPVDTDPTTLKNTELMKKLLSCKRLMICGQASTHSVHFTVLDILHDCPVDHTARMVLLIDAMSPVAGLEEKEKEFIEYVASKGVTICTTTEVFDIPMIPLPCESTYTVVDDASRSGRNDHHAVIPHHGSHHDLSQYFMGAPTEPASAVEKPRGLRDNHCPTTNAALVLEGDPPGPSSYIQPRSSYILYDPCSLSPSPHSAYLHMSTYSY